MYKMAEVIQLQRYQLYQNCKHTGIAALFCTEQKTKQLSNWQHWYQFHISSVFLQSYSELGWNKTHEKYYIFLCISNLPKSLYAVNEGWKLFKPI